MRYKLNRYYNHYGETEYYRLYNLREGCYSFSFYFQDLINLNNNIYWHKTTSIGEAIEEEIGYLKYATYESIKETYPELFI